MNREQENRPDMGEQKAGQGQPEDARSTFEKMKSQAIDQASRRKMETGNTAQEKVMGDKDFEYANKKAINEFFNHSDRWEWVADAPNFEKDGRAITSDIRQTYNKNNGVITAVDLEGHKFAAPFDSDLEQSLLAAGFQINEKMSVPYSNEGPKHPNVKERWEQLWQAHNRREARKGQ